MAETKTHTVSRGCSWPKSKGLRDKIRAGEAVSDEAKAWSRVEAGKGRKIPDDVAADLKRRGIIEEE